MIHFTQQKLHYYKGDFDTFETVRAAQNLQLQRQNQAVEMKQKHIKAFVDKFRYNAKRLAVRGKPVCQCLWRLQLMLCVEYQIVHKTGTK